MTAMPAILSNYRALSRVFSVAAIARRVAYEMGVEARQIAGPRRDAPTARARTAVAWLAWTSSDRTFAAIGRDLGDRDHVTILRAVDRAVDLRLRDPAFRAVTDKVLADIGGTNGR